MRSSTNNNNNITTTITQPNAEIQIPRSANPNIYQIYQEDIAAIGNMQNNNAFERVRQNQNNTTSSIDETNITVSTTQTTTTQNDRVVENTSAPTLPIQRPTHEILLERQARNEQIQRDLPASKTKTEKNINNENSDGSDEIDKTLDEIQEEATNIEMQGQRHVQHYQESAQQHHENAEAMANLIQNPPRNFMNTLYHVFVSWIPNHPFLTIGILGGSFFMGIFIFRRAAGSASSAVSTVVNVGVPTNTTTVPAAPSFNFLTLHLQIQNIYNNINNLGTFGGVLFIIRRVFRR